MATTQDFRFAGQALIVSIPVLIPATTQSPGYILKTQIDGAFDRVDQETEYFCEGVQLHLARDGNLELLTPEMIECRPNQVIDLVNPVEILSSVIDSNETYNSSQLPLIHAMQSNCSISKPHTSASFSLPSSSFSSSSFPPSSSPSSRSLPAPPLPGPPPPPSSSSASSIGRSPQKHSPDMIATKNVVDVFQKYPTEYLKRAQLFKTATTLFSKQYPLYENHSPRLFTILPDREQQRQGQGGGWASDLVFQNRFKVYFLCECGRGQRNKEKSPVLASHVCRYRRGRHGVVDDDDTGYRILRPDEFFKKFAPFLLVILESLRLGVSVGDCLLEPLNPYQRSKVENNDEVEEEEEEEGEEEEEDSDISMDVERAILYLEACWKDTIFGMDTRDNNNHGNPAKESTPSHGARPQQQDKQKHQQQQQPSRFQLLEDVQKVDLESVREYLEIKDQTVPLGGLFRILDQNDEDHHNHHHHSEGRVKWVCERHRSEASRLVEQAMTRFIKTSGKTTNLDMPVKFDPQRSLIQATLKSAKAANLLYKTIWTILGIQQLDLILDWDYKAMDLARWSFLIEGCEIPMVTLDFQQQKDDAFPLPPGKFLKKNKDSSGLNYILAILSHRTVQSVSLKGMGDLWNQWKTSSSSSSSPLKSFLDNNDDDDDDTIHLESLSQLRKLSIEWPTTSSKEKSNGGLESILLKASGLKELHIFIRSGNVFEIEDMTNLVYRSCQKLSDNHDGGDNDGGGGSGPLAFSYQVVEMDTSLGPIICTPIPRRRDKISQEMHLTGTNLSGSALALVPQSDSDSNNNNNNNNNNIEADSSKSSVQFLFSTTKCFLGQPLLLAESPLLSSSMSICQSLARQARKDDPFKDLLREFIERSKTETSMGQAAANAITILVQAGHDFSGTNLSRVQISGANLSHGQFQSVDFSGADLSYTILHHIQLSNSNLKGVQLQGVQLLNDPSSSEWIPTDEKRSRVSCCQFSTNGEFCAFGFFNGMISIYNPRTWERLQRFHAHAASVDSLAFSPISSRQHLLVSGSGDHTVRCWDARTGQPIPEFPSSGHHTNRIETVTISPNGQSMASAGRDKVIRIWDISTGRSVETLKGPSLLIKRVIYSSNGDQLVSIGDDAMIYLWNKAPRFSESFWITGPTLKGPVGVEVHCAVYGPLQGGQYELATGHGDHLIRLWNTRTGQLDLVSKGHTGPVLTVEYSPNGRQLASGSADRSIRLWNSQTGELIQTLQGHTGQVSSLKYSRDGLLLGSCSLEDKTIKLWEVDSGELLTSMAVRNGDDDDDDQDGPWISVSWWATTLGGLSVAIGTQNGSIGMWKVQPRTTKNDQPPFWMMSHDRLDVSKAMIDDVSGLSEKDIKYLKQRGAIGKPWPQWSVRDTKRALPNNFYSL